MMFFKINNPLENYCYIVAEAGINHKLKSNDLKKIKARSSLEVAFKMVNAAKDAGVDAIKFQSFVTENLQLDNVEKPQYQKKKPNNQSYYDLIKSLETSQENQTKIAEYCKDRNITFLSTPYDNESVDFLEEVIDVPFFKLSSIELNNHLFLRYVAEKGKPILLSTGLSTMNEVEATVNFAREEGFIENLILLQCTSNYPTSPAEINLNVLKTFMNEFRDLKFGFSDHSSTFTASIGAVAIGAIIVEKHFTLDKSFEGPDHSSSLNPEELKKWVKAIREISICLGSHEKTITESERDNLSMRKYLVITPQEKGTIIEEEMLKTMRTGKGILPIKKNLKKIIGKKLKIRIEEKTPFNWEMVE